MAAEKVRGCIHGHSRGAKTCRYCYLTKIGALPHDPPWCCGGPENCPEAYPHPQDARTDGGEA